MTVKLDNPFVKIVPLPYIYLLKCSIPQTIAKSSSLVYAFFSALTNSRLKKTIHLNFLSAFFTKKTAPKQCVLAFHVTVFLAKDAKSAICAIFWIFPSNNLKSTAFSIDLSFLLLLLFTAYTKDV